MSQTHRDRVEAQFGAHAQAYVASADHATGADLRHLAAVAAARPGARVLDLGCGGGHVTYAMAPHAGTVVACDLSAAMLEAVAGEARVRGLGNVETARGAAEAIPFPAASFDVVASRYSAHHWGDLAAGLAEVRRVLRPGGLAVMVDVVSPGTALADTFLQSMELLRDPTHVRDYAPDEWLAALRAAGLAPRAPVPDRLRLAFDPWVARAGTPALRVAAIRALQEQMPADVRTRLALEADGTFTVDTAAFEASPA